jgi:hypothetical protein
LPKIDVIVPSRPRAWHERLIERLAAAGHDVAVSASATGAAWPASARLVLATEHRVLHRLSILGAFVPIATRPRHATPDLVIDLGASETTTGSPPTLTIAFDGALTDAVLPAALAAGRLVDVEILLDGRVFERGAPMIDNRVLLSAGLDDVLARAVTLLLKAAARVLTGDRVGEPFVPLARRSNFPAAYAASGLPRLITEMSRRTRYRFAHWRVGYRLAEGAAVSATAALGDGWRVLPDDGTHFYADPFPFEHRGTRYIFVEDYPHVTGKAVISVSTLDADGVAGPPVPVLEEPHHLSYPQVFSHDGALWMLPEASGGGGLVLYRADRFPDRWSRVATLIEGPISDATLLQRDDGFWLFATDRDGDLGSTSDTLAVFHAPALTGPWRPHKANPILVDRRLARPGGAFIHDGARTLLPVQDGTLGYGGGLGLSELLRLDHDAVELSEPRPIDPAGDFPYPQVHTLNRAGGLEVIDGIAAVRKR